jgi:signal transduction histidine kinase
VVAGLLVSRWIYRGVVLPLRELRKGTRNIRDGNLDFDLNYQSGIREIDELTDDFQDMKERLKNSAEEKLDNDKESKELISNISHDLKTPLTTIRGYAAGILDGIANTDEKVQHYVKTIYNKANDMNSLIDELTLYSKIDTNRIPYSFTKVSIADYFADCVEELQPELKEKGIDLVYFNYLVEDAIVIADVEQLKRVINNIISNSSKYMDKLHGVINIRLRDVGDFVQVEIEDNGKGISQKEVTRIFDRFYRTDSSRNHKIGGSGIGLSIVRKILEDHEGKVWATSKMGVGTVIYFVLRKYKEEQADETQNGEEHQAENSEGRR